MAKPTKTKYYDDVIVVCTNGGYRYQLGMTLPSLTIDICGRSHPFYTGRETFVDTTGRIDKFRARLSAANSVTVASKKVRKKSRRLKTGLADLDEEVKTTGRVEPTRVSGKKQAQGTSNGSPTTE